MIMKSKNANRFHYDSWDLDKCALEVDGEERERKEEAARKKWKTGSFLTWKSFNWVNPIICTNNSSAVLPTLLISWLDKAVLFTFSHEPRARMWKCWEFQNWLRERKKRKKSFDTSTRNGTFPHRREFRVLTGNLSRELFAFLLSPSLGNILR